MKYQTKIEIILSSKFSSECSNDRELVTWLKTSLQSVVRKQQAITEKIFFKNDD